MAFRSCTIAARSLAGRFPYPTKLASTTSLTKAYAEPTFIKLANSVVTKKHFEDVQLQNEPILEYKSGSDELRKLGEALERLQSNVEVVPIVIGGQTIKTDQVRYQVMPHRYTQRIAQYYHADRKLIENAFRHAVKVQQDWDNTALEERIAIWERAADLMATKYRADLVAATMLGQGKTIYQAEIDAAAELVDFIRLNAGYLKQATKSDLINVNTNVYKNHTRLRGLEGFVAAISPFNFTAIGGNLAYTPALMGNAVLWKPSDTAVLSSWLVFKIMREAGVPDGVVNFIPADGPTFGDMVTASEYLAGINFTGSVSVFKKIWKSVAANIDFAYNFPRLIGECGGKNFHFVHSSADVNSVVALTIRSAFEYSGQKCSACSRLYVPESLWESKIMPCLVEKTKELIVGDVCNYESFLSAVIDDKTFVRIATYFDYARTSPDCQFLVGGRCSNIRGYFIDPTIILVSNPSDKFLREELFGPVLAVYVYKDKELDSTMDMVATTTKYGLTGSVFATDEKFLKIALQKFKNAAGNFYINDKCTGAIVGQQPFGGARMSGTNDKAGGPHYVMRWTSPQTIKETFVPLTDIYYPYMNMCK